MTRRNLILIVLRDIVICSVILVRVREEWPVLRQIQFPSKIKHTNVEAKLTYYHNKDEMF